MQVESLAVALRKRSNSEAIDLGFALARRWFLRLWSVWLIGALPVFLVTICLILFVENQYIGSIAFLFFWWLKPLYEQPILYILSRQLFSESISFHYIFKDYFQIIKPQLPALLLWRRLSLSRSFNNPVAMLEGLIKKERRTRLNILHSQQSNSSQMLTIVCVHLEVLLYLALLAFAYMLIPTEFTDDDFFDLLVSEGIVLDLIANISYFIAISVIAPFYVAAGFSLYITRRTKLEGWDIELAFKRMHNRLSNLSPIKSTIGNAHLASLAIILCLFTQLYIPTAEADQQIATSSTLSEKRVITKEVSKETIQLVLEKEDFGEVTKENQWVYVGYDEENSEEPPEWLEKFFKWLFGDFVKEDKNIGLQILEFLIWIAIAGLIIWLFRKYSHWMDWINTEPKPQGNRSIPNKIMGMDITQESLPEDILNTVNELLNQKLYREALSLLYRASLAAIVQYGDIEIPSSATEQECSRLVTQARNKNEASYFEALTRTWILLAYGDRIPSEQTLAQLCDDWPMFYGSTA